MRSHSASKGRYANTNRDSENVESVNHARPVRPESAVRLRFRSKTRPHASGAGFACLPLAVFCLASTQTAGITLPHDRALGTSSNLLGTPHTFGRGNPAAQNSPLPLRTFEAPPEPSIRFKLRTDNEQQSDARSGQGREHLAADSGHGVPRNLIHPGRALHADATPQFRALEPGLPETRDEKLQREQDASQPRAHRLKDRGTGAGVQESHRVVSPALDVDCGWCRIPHPLKIQGGGEDVHLISRAGGNTLLAVFDGVGGWKEQGVDAAVYAQRLSSLLEAEFVRGYREIQTQPSPLLAFLQGAFERLEASGLPGSCTACAALLTRDGALHVLNVGDSGLQVVRDGVSVFATHEQQHYFNCPFQLGKGSDDTPADADYYVLEDLAEDDYVVLATDGVWDNLWDGDWLAQLNPGRSCEHIARAVSELAHRNGRDPTFESPFEINAHRHGMQYTGGKLDDVTVVVSRVVRSAAESSEASELSAMDDSTEAG